MDRRRVTLTIAAAMAISAACNRPLPSDGSPAGPILPAPSITPQVERATPTPPAAPISVPTLAPTIMAAQATTGPAPGCANGARFLEDVTIPDGSIFLPGEEFLKIWSVENSGTCDWGADHRLVSLGDAVLNGPRESALFPARAGAVAEWSLRLQAPDQPGEYLARWQARGPDGVRFGDEVFVLIFVQLPTTTPTTSPSPTP